MEVEDVTQLAPSSQNSRSDRKICRYLRPPSSSRPTGWLSVALEFEVTQCLEPAGAAFAVRERDIMRLQALAACTYLRMPIQSA